MSAHVIIPASDDPNDLTVAEWQDLNFALGNVSASTHAAVMTIARRIRVAALSEHDAEVEARVREQIAQAIEADEPFAGPLYAHIPSDHTRAVRRVALQDAARIARGGAR